MSENNNNSAVHVPLSVAAAFEDLETRFILNLPDEELENSARLFFQLEQAWWFYEDFLADKYDHLPHFKKFDKFSQAMFDYCEILAPLKGRYAEMLQEFRGYMKQIPVFGAILLNKSMDSIVLVQSWGGKSWGFPKGKINQGEAPIDCAIREVYEETSFHAEEAKGVVYDENEFLETTSKQGKHTRLFPIINVPEDFDFKPRVRKEIADIKWFKIDSFRTHRDNNTSDTGKDKDKFWQVHAFMYSLRNWIRKMQGHSKSKIRPGGSSRSSSRPDSRSDKSIKSSKSKMKERERGKLRNGSQAGETSNSDFKIVINVNDVMDSMKPLLQPVLSS